MYKPVDFEDYSLRIEVGVIPSDDTSSFLSKLSVTGGIISQIDYEKFLVGSLVKDSVQLKAVLEKLNKRDKDIFHGQLVEIIYKLNNRLRPQHLVIVTDKVMDQSDALRKNLPNLVTLPTNPGWITPASMSNLFNSGPAELVINQAWEDIKRKFPDRDYIKKHINSLNLEVPILQIESVNITAERLAQDYVERRYENDVEMAKSNMLQWKAHVITQTVPRITELYTALAEGNYISIYSENIVMTQLYLAVIEVNPTLDWSLIDWSQYEDRKGDYGAKILKGKKLPGRGRPTIGKSSRAEAEAEKKRFSNLTAQTILGLKERIKDKRIVGQDHAIDAVVDAIAVARVGLRGEEKPVGSWLLPGPTGVGKTEFAKVLAEELGVELVRVDCSEYQHAHEISKLFGAPPGYVGFEDARQESGPPMTLASKVKASPFCVVLFDELEKADKAIFNVLLQIMDDGVVTSGRGESIKFNESIILMTSNVGSKEAQEACMRNPLGIREECVEDKTKLKSETIDATIKELFSPEFLNRLTGIIQFNSLSKEVCRSITDVMLSKTKINLEKAQHMTMSWDDSVKDYLLDEGYSEEYGARNIGRAVQKNLELPLAEWILKNKYIIGDDGVKDSRPDLVKIKVEKGKFMFEEAKCDDGTEKDHPDETGVCNTGSATKRRKPRNGKTPCE
jgi:hypothetical protein